MQIFVSSLGLLRRVLPVKSAGYGAGTTTSLTLDLIFGVARNALDLVLEHDARRVAMFDGF